MHERSAGPRTGGVVPAKWRRAGTHRAGRPREDRPAHVPLSLPAGSRGPDRRAQSAACPRGAPRGDAGLVRGRERVRRRRSARSPRPATGSRPCTCRACAPGPRPGSASARPGRRRSASTAPRGCGRSCGACLPGRRSTWSSTTPSAWRRTCWTCSTPARSCGSAIRSGWRWAARCRSSPRGSVPGSPGSDGAWTASRRTSAGASSRPGPSRRWTATTWCASAATTSSW